MRRPLVILFPGLMALTLLAGAMLAGTTVRAAHAPVGLGTADSFAVLAGSTVTNTGPSVVNGDLGVSPGSAVAGFPPGIVNGTVHAADATATQAQADLTIAYDDAAGRPPTQDLTGSDLGGLTLTDGTYSFSTSAQLTGTVTFDAQGDPNAVFIVQIGSTLTTASASSVNLVNGADACNVFWQVGSSATLGTATAFRGNILALTSITLNTGATIVDGRALARNGAVTLDTNVITRSPCEATASPTPGATATPTPAPTATPTPASSPAATATPAPTAGPTSPGPTSTPVPAASPPTRLPDTSTAGGVGAQWRVISPPILAGLLLLAAVVLVKIAERDRSQSAGQ